MHLIGFASLMLARRSGHSRSGIAENKMAKKWPSGFSSYPAWFSKSLEEDDGKTRLAAEPLLDALGSAIPFDPSRVGV